ncbi:MAG: hypothetical protein HF978_06030 [Desulfobacteraceae bacterium]|nr:hypothetical protein [Desulfobacteraceae bacterium]MBC2755092.1 hypothetical protein [Desulfobacteraceae bacterium]
MSETIEKLKGKSKSGSLAAGLNILLPGVGYLYCGRVILGIIVLPFVIGLIYVQPYAAITIWIVLIIDGFLAAGRYNKKLEAKINAAMKTCPQCAEKIMPEAKVCKHCAYKFDSTPETKSA